MISNVETRVIDELGCEGRKMSNEKDIVLIAGIGTSPAVLTETVWALAHQKPAVVPDKVVVITTTSGKSGLVKSLLSGEDCVWEQLKAALCKDKINIEGRLSFTEDSIKVMLDSKDKRLKDLRNGEENLDAADFMLGEIRQYTEDPSKIVLCSIAGGRKTMSALLFSCMSLLGREQDKVYHVLIPPKYDCGMAPPFYFPQKGVVHELLDRGRKPTGKKIQSSKIGIELFDVPYVRMRGWFQEKFKTLPPSYRKLVAKVQTVAPSAVVRPEVEIDAWNCAVRVGGVELRPSPYEFAVLIMLANGISSQYEMYERLCKFVNTRSADKCDWVYEGQVDPADLQSGKHKFSQNANVDGKQVVSKIMNSLRDKLSEGGFLDVESLVPKRSRAVTFPLSKIKWINREKLADICEYLLSGDDA